MSHECHDKHCTHGHQHHSSQGHTHHCPCCCGCCGGKCQGSCSVSGEHGDFSSQLLEMADAAWMEVLKKKMVEEIERSSGKNLADLAKIVSDANHERWKHRMAKHHVSENFHEQIARFFGGK